MLSNVHKLSYEILTIIISVGMVDPNNNKSLVMTRVPTFVNNDDHINWHHDTQHNNKKHDTELIYNAQHNDGQHNDAQHNDSQHNDTLH